MHHLHFFLKYCINIVGGKMKKINKALENIVSIILTIMIGISGNPIIIIIGFPIILITSSKILNIISRNKVKDSLFSVSKKGKIVQNALANPLKMIKLMKSKNKKESFIEEEKNLFKQLPRTDKKNNVIEYNTISHALTYRQLEKLESEGYIENLKKEEYKKKRLIFEKLLIGNKKNLTKKTQMYKISFEISEKTYQKEITEPIIPVIKDTKQTENMTNQKRIEELKKLKEELTQVEYKEEKTNQK